MNLTGIDGNYGPVRKAVVISFGSVSRGAVRALQARGVQDISVFTQRHYFLVADQMAGVNYRQFEEDEKGNLMSLHPDHQPRPFVEELIDARYYSQRYAPGYRPPIDAGAGRSK